MILGDCWHLLDSSWHLLRADARYDDADPDLSSPGAYVVGLIRNHYLTATAANALPDLLTMIGLPRVANALPMWETVDQASDGDGEER